MSFAFSIWFIVITAILVLFVYFDYKSLAVKRKKEIELLDTQLSILIKGVLNND